MRLFRYTTNPVTCERIWRWYEVVSYVPPIPALLYGPCVRVGALAAGLLAAPLPVPPIPPAWPDFSGAPINFGGPGFGDAYGPRYGGLSDAPLGVFGAGGLGFISGGHGYASGSGGHGHRAHGPRLALAAGPDAGVPGPGGADVAAPAPRPLGGAPGVSGLAESPGAAGLTPQDVSEPGMAAAVLLAIGAMLGLRRRG